MDSQFTMARFSKKTLKVLAKYKDAPRESYDSTLARLLGIKRPSKKPLFLKKLIKENKK